LATPPPSTLLPYTTLIRSLLFVYANTTTTRASPTSNRQSAPVPPCILSSQSFPTHPLILAYRSHLCYSKQSGAVEADWQHATQIDRKSTRLNSSHQIISYA